MFDARRLRVRRLWMAIGSSSLAKLFAVGVQVIAIPLAVSTLGAERYGVFISLTSVLGWISLVDLGVGPGLILGLSREVGVNAEMRRARLVNTACQMMLALTLIVGCAAMAVANIWSVTQIFGASYLAHVGELSLAAIWMVTLVLLQLLLSPVESIRSGYQEQHVSNLLQVLAGFAAGVGLLLVAADHSASIHEMVIALYAPNVACKLINAVLLFRSRAYLIPGLQRLDAALLRGLLATGGTFTLVQLGSLIEQYGVLYLVGRFGGPKDVAEFGVMVKLISLLAGAALMVTQSLWPAYADAIVRPEIDWIRKTYRITFYGCLIAGIGSLAVGLLGPSVVSGWTRGEIVPSYPLCFVMAGVLAVGIWTHVHYMTLVGIGDLRAPSLVMCLRAVVALVLACWTIPAFQAIGAALALLVADTLIAAGYLYWRTGRSLLNLSKPRLPAQ